MSGTVPTELVGQTFPQWRDFEDSATAQVFSCNATMRRRPWPLQRAVRGAIQTNRCCQDAPSSRSRIRGKNAWLMFLQPFRSN